MTLNLIFLAVSGTVFVALALALLWLGKRHNKWALRLPGRARRGRCAAKDVG